MLKKIVYGTGAIVLCIGAYLAGFYLFMPDPVVLDDVSLRDVETKENNKGMAIMLGDEDGNYSPSSESGFPDNSVYKFNSEKSGCIDLSGNIISGVLSYDDASKTALVETGGSLTCYLYFDLITEELFGEYLLENALSGKTAYSGLYRYTGETANNYVDLGGVLYRVIGVTDNSETNTNVGLTANQVKLIKAESIGFYRMHSEFPVDARWNVEGYTVADLYTTLQGNTVLGNEMVIPKSTISTISSVYWYVGKADTTAITNASTVFSYEDNTVTQSTAKVGLMYLSDWYYAYNDGGTQNCSDSKSRCISWMTEGTDEEEWTMTPYQFGGVNTVWYIYGSGYLEHSKLQLETGAVRPVIYLSADVVYTGKGDGQVNSPYELEISRAPVIETTVNNNKTENVTLTITSNESGTYCINKSSDIENMNNCVFSGSITADVPVTTGVFTTFGGYYVHVEGNEYTGISSMQRITTSTTIPLGEYLLAADLAEKTSYSGLYRYAGTSVNNYVDLGGVLYRIIGVTDGSKTNTDLGLTANQVKLIKATSIGDYKWHSDRTVDVRWNVSDYPVADLYTTLQGNTVLGNSTVIPSAWTSKISSVKWYVGDVEMRTSEKGSVVFGLEDDLKTQSTAKVGLMYLSDFYYAYNDVGKSWLTNTNDEWTMTRESDDPRVWYSSSDADYIYRVDTDNAVRPVFYLSPDVIYTGEGDGGSENPYELAIPPVVETTINNNKTENATLTITSNESGTYCVNTSSDVDNMSNCLFSGSITANTPVTTSVFTAEGTYYVHVDGNDYIGISSVNTIKFQNLFGEYLLENALSGKNACGGLYRYTGETANNYVSVGGVLYRVIGVTDDSATNTDLGLTANQVKVIKAESIGAKQWYTNNTTDVRWNESGYTVTPIYTELQSSSVLGSSTVIPSAWTSKISSVYWYVGNVQISDNGSIVFRSESNATTQSTSKVGLMYLSDWYYAYIEGGTQQCTSSPYCVSWMTDGTNTFEWTMTRYGYEIYGDYYAAREVHSDGSVTYSALNGTYAVRPVFYLDSSLLYTGEGNGSSGSPYIIE